jgi:FecR-like protein
MARFCLAAIFVVVAMALSISPTVTSSAADLQEWVAVQIEGSVEFKRGGSQWSALRRGDTVIPGYEIRTGPNAKILLSRGSETITIEPESTLKFLSPGNGSVTRIFQKLGGAIFNIKKRNRKHFEVLTPHLVATVKGTEFSIKIDSNGGTLNVINGSVGVTNKKSGKSVDVSAGQFAMVNGSSGAIAIGGASVSTGGAFATYATVIAVVSVALGLCLILFLVYTRKRANAAGASKAAGWTSNR